MQPRDWHLVEKVANLWKMTLPLLTAKTLNLLGNFLAQYLATEADERILWWDLEVPRIREASPYESTSRLMIFRTGDPRQTLSFKSTYTSNNSTLRFSSKKKKKYISIHKHSNLLQVAESFISGQHRVKRLHKREQSQLPLINYNRNPKKTPHSVLQSKIKPRNEARETRSQTQNNYQRQNQEHEEQWHNRQAEQP